MSFGFICKHYVQELVRQKRSHQQEIGEWLYENGMEKKGMAVAANKNIEIMSFFLGILWALRGQKKPKNCVNQGFQWNVASNPHGLGIIFHILLYP